MRGEDGRMNIIVFIKQIPDTDKVRLDEHGNLLREGVESIINPVDKNAIEAGLRLRDEHGGKVTAVTMGPPQAAEVLNRALFMGCDDVVLLSDRAFGGADTLATGYTLAMAAKKLGGADLLIFGNRAADAETAQTGPVNAGFLGLPLVTSVSELSVEDGWAVCTREFALGVEKCRVRLPAVITVKPELNTPRFQTPANVIAGLKKPLKVWDSAALGSDSSKTGVCGSPSRTKRVVAPPARSMDTEVIGGSNEEMAGALAALLAGEHLI